MLWIVYLGITFVNIIALALVGMPIFDSICHAFTIMPTGGFSIKNASIAYYDNYLIEFVIMFFMLLAGVNFSLHYKALNGSLKSYSKDREFIAYLFLIVSISFLIFLSILNGFKVLIPIFLYGSQFNSSS